MKVSRVLQLDKLNKDGLAPVRLVVSWQGQRIRMATGCLVKPEHWDAKAKLVKVQNGTPHHTLNPRLTKAGHAAGAA